MVKVVTQKSGRRRTVNYRIKSTAVTGTATPIHDTAPGLDNADTPYMENEVSEDQINASTKPRHTKVSFFFTFCTGSDAS
jgi:hypothetical protein